MMKKGIIKILEKKAKKRFQDMNKNLDFKNNLGEKILDFGCGFGFLTKTAASRYKNKKFIGYDIDKKSLNFAREINAKCNIRYTDKLKGKYDSIVVSLSIHEIKTNLRKILKQLSSSLKKNGKILIFEFRKSPKNKLKKLYNSNIDPHKGTFEDYYKRHTKWSSKEFGELMESVGLKTIKIEDIGDCWLYYIGEN